MRLRLSHPLAGSGVTTLVRVLADAGPLTPGGAATAAFALASGVLRLPFTLLERALVRAARGRLRDVPPPVFIVGHWRSGTTHLYNLLARSPRFGFVSPLATGLPWEFLTLGRLLAPLLERALPTDRFIDRVPVRPDSPQEDETALSNMQTLSFYHGLYFPRRFDHHFRRGIFFEGCSPDEIRRWERRFVHFMDKLALQQEEGRRLLIKNPVYTARIARLRSLYPEARFVHIHRNPYVVFPSTRHFYHKLFEKLALQDWREVPVDRVVLEAYPRMMGALLGDAARLPPGHYTEVRFEDLEARPLEVVEALYGALGLEGFEEALPRFESYLVRVRGYRRNRYDFPEEDLQAVREHWAPFLERWDYAPPEAVRG